MSVFFFTLTEEKNVLTILNKLPKGKMLKPQAFAQIGAEEAQELRRRQITLIGEEDGHFHITAKGEHEFALAGGGSLKMARQAAFACAVSDNPKRIVFDQFEGVTITRPGAPGWFDVLSIDIVPGKKKDTVEVTVLVKVFVAKIPFTETHSRQDLAAIGWQLPF